MKLRSARDAAFPLLAVVLVILVVIAVVAIVVFAPISSVQVDERRAISQQEGAEELRLELQVDVGQVSVQFVEPPANQDLVVLTVQGTVRQNLLGEGDPVSITFSHDMDQGQLTVAMGVDLQSFSTTVGYDGLRITVAVSEGLRTSIEVSHSVGDVLLTAGSGAHLGAVSMTTTTGMVRADLGAGVQLSGDMEMTSTTGASVLDWFDVWAIGNRTVSMSTTTGGIDLDVEQGTIGDGNVTFEASASTGGVRLELDIEGEVSAQVSSSANVGNVDVEHRDGFTGEDELLRSSNFPAVMNLDLTLTTSTGGVDLDLSYRA